VDLTREDLTKEPDWDALAEKESVLDSYERGYEVA